MGGTTSIRIDLSADELRALDQWRAANGRCSRADAVRRLVRLGFNVAGIPDDESGIDAASD